MKQMVVVDDIHLYLTNDQIDWRKGENAKQKPKSFVLEQCISRAPWSLYYRQPDGQLIKLKPFSGSHEIQMAFIRLQRECRNAIRDRRPEMADRIYFTVANYLASSVVIGLVGSQYQFNLYDRVRVCTRTNFSDITNLSSNDFVFVVLEDQQIPRAIHYINANNAVTNLNIGDIPGLDLALARLPPHYLISELDNKQLSPLISCFESYLTKLVPMPVCKQLTRDILKSFKLTNVSQNMLLQRLYSLGAECDWGVESGVIVDVLIHFLILLRRTFSKLGKSELKEYQNQAQLFDLLVGVLVVSCKLATDIGSLIENSEFAMRSNDEALDVRRVNHMERVVLSRNQYSFRLTEKELKEATGRLDSQKKKHANLRGGRYWLWFKSANQQQENSDVLSERPKRIRKRK